MNLAEHGNAADPGSVPDQADLTARRVRGRSIGRTEEANASGNELDMLTSVWSEMAREQAEPPTHRRKQMTTDSRRLMRPGVVAPTEHDAKRLPVRIAKLAAHPDSGSFRIPREEWPYEGSSRMKGNFHVRFLGECGRGNPPALTRLFAEPSAETPPFAADASKPLAGPPGLSPKRGPVRFS